MKTNATLKDFICEIKDIARENRAPDFSAAVDMFLANIANTADEDSQYHYAGADLAVPYAKLYPVLDALREEKAGLVAFHKENIAEVNRLYDAGKRGELRKWAAEVLG